MTSRDAAFQCRCGQVSGRVRDASSRSVNRVVCYCDDCQAFLHHLRRADLLDAHGGTDIVQVAPAAFTVERGAEHIAGLRLGPKGLYRWYASCCNTPLGNTTKPSIPFVGAVAQVFRAEAAGPDDLFGPPVGAILGKYAIGSAPRGSEKVNYGLLVRAIRSILGWRLSGKHWPHPFFDRATGAPRYPVTTLSRSERDALRPRCGPHPSQ